MLLRRVRVTLCGGHPQGVNQLRASLLRLDDVVNVPFLCRHVRVGKFVFKFLDPLSPEGLDVGRLRQLPPVENIHGPLGPHHGDLGRWKGQIVIGPHVLGPHHAIGPPIGLADDDREFRHRGLTIGKEELGPVLDNPAVFLGGPGEISGDILKSDDRDVEAVAGPDEPGSLNRGVDIQTAGQHHGLVGNNPHGLAVQPREADEDVLREMFLHLEEIALINDHPDEFFHVVRFVRIVGDDGVQRFVHPVGIVPGLSPRRIFEVVLGEKAQELSDGEHTLLF